MATHKLKIKYEFFRDILNMYKRFEIRKNDRGYTVGDILELHELIPDVEVLPGQEDTAFYTGNVMTVKVNYILDDFEGLVPGYVAMNVVRVEMFDSKINA